MSAFEVRPFEPRDEPALAALAGSQGLLSSPAGRAWVEANPAGRRLFVAERGGSLLAAFGILPVRTRLVVEERVFAEVHAPFSVREGAEAALLAAAHACLAAHAAPGGDLVLYGWPGEPAERWLKERLEFELLRVSSVLLRPLEGGASAPAGAVRELERFGSEVDRLYAACATHWEASAVRDAAFLAWRFAAHPLRRATVFGLANGEELRGYAAYRPSPELAPGLGLLLDWLVLPGDDGAAEELLAAVLARARADGLTHLAASVPEWSPWSLLFQERGFLHHPGAHRLLVRGATPRHDMLWLRTAWWTTLADALAL